MITVNLLDPSSGWTHTARVIAALWTVQGGVCSICGREVAPVYRPGRGSAASRDHTFPRFREQTAGRPRPPALGRWGGHLRIPITMAHAKCNSRKGARWPTGCEMIWLLAVNARLGAVSLPKRETPLVQMQRELACA